MESLSLFDDNRLNLKPVRELNRYIQSVFETGQCQCMRCISSEHDESDYITPHTYHFSDGHYHRIFSKSTPGELLAYVVKAYESAYKDTWPFKHLSHIPKSHVLNLLDKESLEAFWHIIDFCNTFEDFDDDIFILLDEERASNVKSNVKDWFNPSSKVLFADTETTGFKPAEIIQLALIDTTGKTVFSEFFKPISEIHPKAEAVHGYNAEALADKPLFSERFDTLKSIIQSHKIVFFNKDFDIGALKTTCDIHEVSFDSLALTFDCAMDESVKYLGSPSGSGRISLENALKHSNLEFDGDAHDAETDARATYDLARSLCDRHLLAL